MSSRCEEFFFPSAISEWSFAGLLSRLNRLADPYSEGFVAELERLDDLKAELKKVEVYHERKVYESDLPYS